MTNNKARFSTRDLVVTAIFAAALCVVSPFTIPIGPVPISLATLMIYITAGVLGAQKATVAVALYVALGAFGLPVFTNFGGGLPKIVGATGGYIVGYVPLALLCGLPTSLAPKKFFNVLFPVAAVVGTAVLYALGTAWFVFSTGNTLAFALSVCVVPFIAGDLAKIVVAQLVSPVISRQARLR